MCEAGRFYKKRKMHTIKVHEEEQCLML